MLTNHLIAADTDTNWNLTGIARSSIKTTPPLTVLACFLYLYSSAQLHTMPKRVRLPLHLPPGALLSPANGETYTPEVCSFAFLQYGTVV